MTQKILYTNHHSHDHMFAYHNFILSSSISFNIFHYRSSLTFIHYTHQYIQVYVFRLVPDIGVEAARQMAARGARIVLACSDQRKVHEAKGELGRNHSRPVTR